MEAIGLDEPLNWPTRVVMLIGGLMVTIALSALTPVLPQIETALARTEDEKLLVKMLIPIVGATMVIGAPLTGYLIQRVGLRIILAAHSLIFAVAGTAGFYLGNLEMLLVLRLFVGLSAAGMATISMTLINTRLQDNDRARWMGFHIAAAMLGALVVHPIVGLLGELGWRWPFLAYGASLILTFVALAGAQEAGKAAPADPEGPREERNPLKWFPLWFLPFALVMGSVTYLPTVYLPFVARDVGVMSPAVISMIMLADVIIGASMSLIFGWSQRRISSETAFIISFAFTGTGMVIVSLATGLTGVFAGMLVFGFGIGWFVPNLMTALSRRVTQAQQGPAVGIIKGAHYLASPLAILAVEPIARAFGPAGAMMAGAVASFAVVATFIALTASGAVRLRPPIEETVPAE